MKANGNTPLYSIESQSGKMALRRLITRPLFSFSSLNSSSLGQCLNFSTEQAVKPALPKLIFIPKKKSADQLQEEAAKAEEKTIEEYRPSRIDIPLSRHEYLEKVVPSMLQSYNYETIQEVPRVMNVIVYYGLLNPDLQAKATQTKDLLPLVGKREAETAAEKKKKAQVSLKFKENVSISEPVILSGKVMYNLLDRLINKALPSAKEFKGLNPKNFDKDGLFFIGLPERSIFPELPEAEGKMRYLDLYIKTSAKTVEESVKLLSLMGMPFSEEEFATFQVVKDPKKGKTDKKGKTQAKGKAKGKK